MTQPARVQGPGPGTRLVVYTALVGAKEPLNDPLEILPAGASSDLELEFVCLTDDRSLRSPTWRFRYLDELALPQGHLPPEKLSRRPKAMPHEYFADADFSLYIDNTVAFRRLPQSSDLATAEPQLFKAFRHARHTQLEQEAYAISVLGYEEPALVCRQLEFYASHRIEGTPLADVTPLTTGTVLLRAHHQPAVRRFGQLWWESILAFSKRDQLSLDVARRLAGCGVEYLPGITRENEFIRWQGSLASSRLRASFDAKRYAWQHRGDPEARRDPKAHALAHGRGADPDCQRPARMMEYLCHVQGSSLGAQVSPRRGVADALEAACVDHRQDGGRCVVVRVKGVADALAFGTEELDTGSRAVAMLMGANAETSLLDLTVADLENEGRVYTAVNGQPYQLAVVLGATGAQLPALAQKLVRLLPPKRGGLVFVACGDVTLAQAAEAERTVQTVTGLPVRTMLSGASHDALARPLANAVVGLSWS